MENVGKKVIINEPSVVAEKVEEFYPTVTISADRAEALKQKKFNALFPLNAVVRIVGINDSNGETNYTLEVREIEVLNKKTEDMSPEELREHIEQSVEEKVE